jgi:acyl-CoA reductase-like NAD-dependent aldehyde dehydrogenase
MTSRDCLPLSDRLRWIERFDRLVGGAADRFVELIGEEIAKPPVETVAAEILPLRAACRWHRRHARRLLAPRRVGGAPWWLPGVRSRVERQPLGSVAIVATWNYPLQLLGIQLLQAVAAGNRVVVKPSERAPRTHALLLSLAQQAGLPEGWLRSTEPTREAGRMLLERERFDHLIFTGSTAVGFEIAAMAARSLTPTTLELSGRDSAIVLGDADPRLAARCLWLAATMNAGQTCMAPRRILVERRVLRRFLDELAPLAAAARPRRLIDASAAALCHHLAADAIACGGRSVSGVCEAPQGAALRPLAIAECPPEAALFAGDHFGPVVAVTPVDCFSHALELHGRIEQHLAVSVFTAKPSAVASRLPELRASTVLVNDCLTPTAHPAVSIGGHGLSGWGASRGREGLLALTRPVHLARTSGWWRVPPEIPGPAVARLLRRVAGRGGIPSTAARPAPQCAPSPTPRSSPCTPVPARSSSAEALPASPQPRN